ncbi:MAG: phage holin family protein [Lactobacillus sp.]|jgi:putative membrane protein|uniref:phage holin family protein n=1 Tax=Paucilactobacillus vaccinostercus TaxID=176291 RepID=UPI0007096822|nr:phage holin family protein [Paucilactobacillus vaccinostercus]RRG09165.1 MAG: phage holin family protein [Lactobacillus sp.]
MGFWTRICVNTVLFIAIAGFLSQSGAFYVTGIGAAFLASLVLAVLNALVRPILFLLSLPITVMTLGLFSIILNAVMLQLTSYFVGANNFHFSSFGVSIIVAIIISVCNAIISSHFVNRRG